MTPSEIKSLRTKLGLTQSQFASKLGVSAGTSVSRWECGSRSPSPLALKELRKLEKKKPAK